MTYPDTFALLAMALGLIGMAGFTLEAMSR